MRYLLSITNRKTKDIPFMDAFSMVDPYRLPTNFLERMIGLLPALETINLELNEIMARPIVRPKV